MRQILLAASCCALMLSCKSRQFDQQEVGDVQIWGGAPVAENADLTRSVVAVVSPDLLISCTGTLYKELGLVVTAAHCFGQMIKFSGYPDGVFVFTGTQPTQPGTDTFNPKANPENTYPVIWAAVNPGYWGVDLLTRLSKADEDFNYPKKTLSDIAILRFSTTSLAGSSKRASTSTPLKPLQLLDNDAEIPFGAEKAATLAGYGCSSEEDMGWGTLRTLTTANVVKTAKEKAAKEIQIQTTSKGVCQGDSGGPILLPRNNTFVLAGVLSRGIRSPHQNSHGGIYTNPVAYADWLNGHASKEPCRNYKVKAQTRLFSKNGPQDINAETPVQIRFFQGNPGGTDLKGLAQVEVEAGNLKGWSGTMNASDLIVRNEKCAP